MEYGYARVSAKEQNGARQLLALAGFGIPPKQIYVDKQSGKDFVREQYARQNKDLNGALIADIVLQLLSYVAQTATIPSASGRQRV